MRILITGHRGYIGVEMVSALRAAGHEIVGLDVGYYDGCDFINPPDKITEYNIDLRDVTFEHCKGFDAVIHLAALSSDPLGRLKPPITTQINFDASMKLARAAKKAGVTRFLFASSCSLYGASAGGYVNEEAVFNPVTEYGQSKVLVEQALSKLADSKFSPVYLRNSTAYGVSRRLRADLVVNNLVGYAVTEGKVLLKSDGSAWRPLVHIADIIDAFKCCLTAPIALVHNQAFNVGRTGENFRIRDVAEIVAEIVPNSSVAFSPGASADLRNYRVSFKKIETTLPGYNPQWTLRKGIAELYEAYINHGLTKEEWLKPRYFRLQTIQDLQSKGRLDDNFRFH